MKKSFLAFIAVILGLLGCSANDDRDSISGARFEFKCDALIDDGANGDGLWNPRNYSGSGVHLTTEEVAEAIARCKSVQLADQSNDIPLGWDSFAFNGRIYYHVPLANDVPSN